MVDDADSAIAALKPAGWNVVQLREVLAVSLDDRPGELGRYARRLANAGITITSLYTAGGQAGDVEVIVAAENLEAARPPSVEGLVVTGWVDGQSAEELACSVTIRT